MEPAVVVVVEPGDKGGVDDQVVDGHSQLEASTASATKASPCADRGELVEEPAAEVLQGGLAQGGGEQ